MGAKAEKRVNVFSRFAKAVWFEHSIVLVAILIFIVATIINPRFAQVSNILVIMRQASIIGMIALGMTFVIIAGGIDLSSGHVVAAAGAVLITVQGIAGVPLPVALLACIVAATAIGLLNGVLITKFVLPPFIATLAIGTIARSLTGWALRGATISGNIVPAFTNIGNGSIVGIPIPMIIWVAFTILFGYILSYTKFGIYVYAIGGNENAAKYSGMPVKKVRVITYCIVGLCVGVAAIIDFSRMASVAPITSGAMYEFDAITAAVVGGAALSGGRGKILNTFFGVFIISIVSNLMIMMQLSPFLTGTVRGVIILAAVLFQKKER